MKIIQLFSPKYKNRIINKIRELEIECLKINMQKSRMITNTKEYVRLWYIQKNLEQDIDLLKTLLK